MPEDAYRSARSGAPTAADVLRRAANVVEDSDGELQVVLVTASRSGSVVGVLHAPDVGAETARRMLCKALGPLEVSCTCTGHARDAHDPDCPVRLAHPRRDLGDRTLEEQVSREIRPCVRCNGTGDRFRHDPVAPDEPCPACGRSGADPDVLRRVRAYGVALLRWCGDQAPTRKTLVHCRTLANQIERAGGSQ